jgi:predicted NodU family carbamoyl transferase
VNFLGIGDGLDAGAALIVDDRLVACCLQSRFDRAPRSRAFPWEAIDGVLREGGLEASAIDIVAVAGRFSPPFFLRRHPRLRSIARDAFSPALDAQVFYQALLRQTGMGALEADRTSEWFEKRLAGHGISPQRVTMVDIHTALAEGAYRSQPEHDVLVFVVHPMGDGVSCSVHRGRYGQLDRIWEQRGFATVHVHLQRCAQAIGRDVIYEADHLWTTAAGVEPDAALVAMLRRLLTVEGARLSRRMYPLPVSAQDEVYDALRRVPVPVAAASILRNLEDAVMGLLTHHVMETKCDRVVLAGGIFENSRLCGEIVASEILNYFHVSSTPGWALLPFGAAATEAGLSPGAQHVNTGSSWPAREPREESGPVVAKEMAERLASGEVILRCAGRESYGRAAVGTRSILVSVDQPQAAQAIRQQLGFDSVYEPTILMRSGYADFAGLAEIGELSRVAVNPPPSVSKRVGPFLGADGKAHFHLVSAESDPTLFEVLKAMGRGKRPGLMLCFRLPAGALGGQSDALKLWERCPVLSGLVFNEQVQWRTGAQE